MTGNRPRNCRFRLQEEGLRYPRSSCSACKKTIATDLGNACTFAKNEDNRLREPFDQEIVPEFGA